MSILSRKRAGSARVIFTADDFGLHEHVNEAVMDAAGRGVLSTASLMVGAPAAEQAVQLARDCPTLGVGLHLVLADGLPVLPATRIPDLLGPDGRFDERMLGPSLQMAFNKRVQRQLEAEIHAQFQAFAATGLPLDHVNAHKHFHLHPLIAATILRIGSQYGLKAMRLPLEKANSPRRHPGALAERWATRSAALSLRRRLDRAGIKHNDQVRGLAHTGHMTEARLLEALDLLPASGVTEIYTHPATTDQLTASMADYDHTGEYKALISPRVKNALQAHGLTPIRFADLEN